MVRVFGEGAMVYVVQCDDCRARGPEQATPEAAEHEWNARFGQGAEH
jgi:hypothetical protein